MIKSANTCTQRWTEFTRESLLKHLVHIAFVEWKENKLHNIIWKQTIIEVLGKYVIVKYQLYTEHTLESYGMRRETG